MIMASKTVGGGDPDGYGGIYRYDILDHTGKVVVSNVTEVYGSGPDRIALHRGFSVGLMDWSGNWIVKRDIFSGDYPD
jgi:hypothetical protein